ncbi:hypothetical protein [Biostraticola tofi]|uniref:Uncharacterized protein n=1 Tax=Biostraticola tofi TaxID=466109 RepID=A0A4R3Z6W4_9GAMM|nr:hypothetical protein [Biostraticola tofi]TCV99779.1 hypothetical protein EDC52_101116 [Biostraticola tofi]
MRKKKVTYIITNIPNNTPPSSELVSQIQLVRKTLFSRNLAAEEIVSKFFPVGAYNRRCIIFFDETKTPSGYLCLQTYKIQKLDIAIFRNQVALLNKIRGKVAIKGHILVYLFSDWRVYLKKCYLLYYMINPLSYALVMKFLQNGAWPGYQHGGSTTHIEKYRQIITEIDRSVVEVNGVFVHESNDGAVVEEIDLIEDSDTAFFLQKNAGYTHGDGLVVLAEINVSKLVTYLIRYFSRKWVKNTRTKVS